MENTKRRLTVIFLIVAFAAFCVFNFSARAEDASEISGDIKKIEEKLEDAIGDKKELTEDLGQVQSSIQTTQQAINKTESIINETEKTISRKEQEINDLNKKIEAQKEILGYLMREMYYGAKEPLLSVAVQKSGFTQMLGGEDHILTLENKINLVVQNIKSTKEKINEDKKGLEEDREDHERLLVMKESQQKTLVGEKIEIQSDIAEKEATISQLNAKLSKLKSELSGLLGKSYTAKNIEDAASFASKATGVRKDFLLGMLVVESDLGRFTGGCTATESRMSSYRLGIFKDICEELDYNWKKQKVSCPPRSYKGTGGAMGVAQFMSDTWLGYKSSIASHTGHNPPDPWNLTDGVVAMALKLARGGATSKSGECKAAKLYLSGTTSSKYNWYCDRVSYWANNYESKF